MITRTLSRLARRTIQPCFHTPWTANFSVANYKPPASKLQQFTESIVQLQDESSFKKAAELMATLEADQQIYKKLLDDLNEEIASYEQHEYQVVNHLRVREALEQQVLSTEKQNQGIIERSNKEIDNIRIYGVTRIAKQIIEVADHLTEAISMCEKKASNKPHLDQLHKIYQELLSLLKDYEIYPVNPTNLYFDPNEHHNPTLINLVAQTKRIGWKLKTRVLREAYVVIYK